MTYAEGRAAMQLLAEREIGVPLREHARRENAAEDRSIAALRREQQELV